VKVVFAVAGTLVAAVLVATLGDGRGHEALLAARHAQEQQLAGSWAADHKGMMRLSALHKLSAKHASLATFLATKAPGDQSSDDDESGAGDVKETVANKLFGAEAGSGGNAAAPPYEVEEDSDVGQFPHCRPCDLTVCGGSCVLEGCVVLAGRKRELLVVRGCDLCSAASVRLPVETEKAADASVLRVDGTAGNFLAGIAVSNFPGDYIAGTDSNDYTEDLERRMEIHRWGWEEKEEEGIDLQLATRERVQTNEAKSKRVG
jgi:hypothetical protein